MKKNPKTKKNKCKHVWEVVASFMGYTAVACIFCDERRSLSPKGKRNHR